jgi:hypothetical protein
MLPSNREEYTDSWRGWNDVDDGIPVPQEYDRNKKFLQVLENMAIASKAANSMHELSTIIAGLSSVRNHHDVFVES